MTKREYGMPISHGLSISSANAPEARMSDLVLWYGGETAPPERRRPSTGERKAAREKKWRKRRNAWVMFSVLLLIAAVVIAVTATISMSEARANNQQAISTTTTKPPKTSIVDGSVPDEEEEEENLDTIELTTIEPIVNPQPSVSKTIPKPPKPSTPKPPPATLPSEVDEEPAPIVSKGPTTTPKPSLVLQTPKPTSTPSKTTSPTTPPTLAKATMRILNNCASVLNIVLDLRHGMNLTTNVKPLAIKSYTDIATTTFEGAKIRVGESHEATKFQVFRGGNFSYSISVIPYGCTEGHSWEECKMMTGMSGYNVPMQIEPQNGSLCDKINCTTAKCPSAMLHPFDDKSKVHYCDKDFSLLLTVC